MTKPALLQLIYHLTLQSSVPTHHLPPPPCFNRTAALLVLVAASIAVSGGEMPRFGVGDSGNGDSSISSSGGGGAAWAAYLCKGINSALIERHFEGLVSALGCMYVHRSDGVFPPPPPFFAACRFNGDGT